MPLHSSLAVAVLLGLVLGLTLSFTLGKATQIMRSRGCSPAQILFVVILSSVIGACLGWVIGVVLPA